ncbi:hypothetical protein [Streptomyces sp. NPDC002088]|uniref:hypothetical protein n=1 Tax=Streptomyces sp. NPDC002088 TaxID=3154665 RepID=UPI003333D602
MSWLRRRRYAVPGIAPHESEGGWDGYLGTSLAERPVVAAALMRAPRRFADLVFAPGDREQDLSQGEFLAGLLVSTADGQRWLMAFSEELMRIVDSGPDLVEEDLLLSALEAQPGVVEADHQDRELLNFRVATPITADEALALAVDAMAAGHRALATRLGVELPE